MSWQDKPFFVGYLAVPAGLKTFLIAAGIAIVAFFAAMAFAMGLSQDDPGPGAFRFDLGRQTVTGVLEMAPYPVVHVT
ncbi:MAG: hypothetical protein AAFX00_06985, partial [Pseudomonadota bacterium]